MNRKRPAAFPELEAQLEAPRPTPEPKKEETDNEK